MHQALQKTFKNDADVVFLYAQTVFEGYARNSFEAGLKDLKRLGIVSPYAFDPGVPAKRKPSSIMSGYLIRGTPWTIVIDTDGVVRYSSLTEPTEVVQKAIEAARERLLERPAPLGGSEGG